MDIPASYAKKPWKALGLQSMITALSDMDSSNDSVASNACMVFAVHLSEACRIKFIRLKIAQSIMPCVSNAQDLIQGEDQVLGTESCRDIFPSLRPIIVDLNFVVDGDDQVVAFIKHFKQLCKAWMTYVLSHKSVCPLSEKIADACGVKYVRTLRHSLSLLSNTSLRKILEEWEKKFRLRKSPANFQQADLDFMRSMVLQFENSSM
ncbi:unnamed protein product [Amaranthus hypochondriacus]